MTTKTCGEMYEHANTYPNYIDYLIDYGWYKHFRTVIPSWCLKLTKMRVPSTILVSGNPQRTLLENV